MAKPFLVWHQTDTRSVAVLHLVTESTDAMLDLHISLNERTPIFTSSLRSIFITQKFAMLSNPHTVNLEQQRDFQETLFGTARTVRDSVNKEKRDFGELLNLLDEAEKLKRWLGMLNQDKVLMQEFLNEISSFYSISRMPTKTFRFFLFALAGLVNPAVGVALSAADSFLIDRMVEGWKPGLFVNGPLLSFVSK
jgi:hypothetical protein